MNAPESWIGDPGKLLANEVRHEASEMYSCLRMMNVSPDIAREAIQHANKILYWLRNYEVARPIMENNVDISNAYSTAHAIKWLWKWASFDDQAWG